MNHTSFIRFGLIGVLLAVLGLRSASVESDPAFFAGTPASIAQAPLYMKDAVPPLNMLVLGKDHKIYYEAYNDASDLDGDGALDVGYHGWELKSPAPPAGTSPYKIDYYGYFNSFACYTYDGAKFVPRSATTNKQCSGQWSGDFLNYLVTSRMDALRRVLYGGWRQVDTATETTLQGAFFPQDAHSWGKEYQSVARDGYDIANYAPLAQPGAGLYHLFAVTTFSNNTAPVFRVMQGTPSRVWNWLSIEGPVAGHKCFSAANARIDCVRTARDDYAVRVLTCPASDATVRDATCKFYPNGGTPVYKPTGILHDYGETQKMYFGLITGSQNNNLEGGILRRNVLNFADEIDPDTGIFKPAVIGIAHTIDRLRMIGGGYNSGVTNNLGGDTNWNWANTAFGVGGNCASQGDRALNNGECRMWGNPIAEMLYEGMRYFAGAGAATTRFASGGSSQGQSEETAMGLPTTEVWKDPYATDATGLSYPTCAKPNQTVISDINPSYDGDLPGSAFAGAITTTNNTPASIAAFNASQEGQAIWSAEPSLGGPRDVSIGEVAGVTDGAPTVKRASSFGNIRGLSPEEPTKGGTYYSASVARFGRNNDLNAAPNPQNLSTYAVALASPLPRIEFPVGGRTVTLLPFAKTASGTFGTAARKPTNTIVDFYVEQIVNLPRQRFDASVNGGRPYAVFRINYEDVEQGNDHDMDAIVRYEVIDNGGTVTVNLSSDYAAGSADQNIGYALSGTTQDGIYLDVRDRDSTAGTFLRYDLNTPPGISPGGCTGVVTGACNAQLPLTSSRTFTPSSSASTTTPINNPLWYAAKYGAPDLTQWDADANGTPDNYFLVTNPLQLRAQLSKAFDDIANRNLDIGAATISGARVGNASFTLQPTFQRERNGKDWTGNIAAIQVKPDGSLGTALWDAQVKLPPLGGTAAGRNIKVMVTPGVDTVKLAADFQASNLGLAAANQFNALGINPLAVATTYGATYTPSDIVAYLRGDGSREARQGGAANTLRTRSSVLGDIVNSEPIVASPKANFGYGAYSGTMFSGYAAYLTSKSSRKTVVYVGANDGMLHAFDGTTQPCPAPNATLACTTPGAGDELFAFIPNDALNKLGLLPVPDARFDHRYYVDGQVTVGDAKSGSTWTTLLAGSMGAGGRSIYVLDVSTPNTFGAAQALWEYNSAVDTDMGHTFGKPLIVPLENGSWGVLFGNGFGSNSNDPLLYILDAFTGQIIKKIRANDGDLGNDGETGAAAANDPYNGLGQITAIDRDGNGKADTVYGGDLQGNVWKFNLSSTAMATAGTACAACIGFNGNGLPLFQAITGTERQPITGGIRVAAGPGSGVMVYFGTGRYFVNGDNNVPATPQIQSLYGVFDTTLRDGTGGSTAGLRSNLVAQSITSETTGGGFTTRTISQNPVLYFGATAKRGWFLDLTLAAVGVGERFIAVPRIQSGKAFFTTYTPTLNSCDPGGTNFIYALDLLSGSGALANVRVLPSGTAACTGADCGGAAVTGGSGGTQPPITGTGVVATSPIVPVSGPGSCVPGAAGCPTFEECQVVIYPGAFVLPRACGRQSWRQLK